MTTWRDISVDSDYAARELFNSQRWRSCISRAYYAVYSRVTDRLHRQGVRPRSMGRNNPAHDALPGLVTGTLARVTPFHRRLLKRSLERLYQARVASDYLPGRTIDEAAAREAMGYMTTALRVIELEEVRR